MLRRDIYGGSNRRSVFVIFAVLMVALASAGYLASRPGRATAQKPATSPARVLSASSVATSLLAAATVPDGYNPIEFIAGDPSINGGVWFFDSSTSADTLFHVSPAGDLTSWNLLSGSSYLAPQVSPPVVATPSGTVWVGINDDLVSFNADTGAIADWSVPTPEDNALAESFRPTSLQGLHAIQAIAVAPDGNVAVAMSAADNIEIFSPNSSSFTSVALSSAGEEPIALAYSQTNLLAVGVSDLASGGLANTLVLVDPDGTEVSSTLAKSGSAWTIAPYGNSQFVVGSIAPELVSSDGSMVSVSVPFNLIGGGSDPTPFLVLSNGKLMGIGQSGLVEFPEDSPSSAVAEAGATVFSPPSAAPDSAACLATPSQVLDGGHSPATSSQCSAGTFQLVTLDGAGNIWVVPPGGAADSVAVLSAGTN